MGMLKNELQKTTQRVDGTRRVQTLFKGPSLTKQADAKDADINNIMAKYERTGMLPIVQGVPTYADFSNVASFQEAQNLIIEAAQAFEQLPAKVRKHFDNDPGAFLGAFEDPSRREELEGLGLVEKRAEGALNAPSATPAAEAPKI